ncbi:efflux RND transporter periplasmic adaptor subunit [Cryomorpha ignava]|uniref:Efflux RND transporter periplasmic adaptor subunit n=1 Tax=Cryomorpha ignava TaxID=101383 RepID=A0A7K3WKU1_9FLAO|nr:efflux RND transporter periplasmic adaptor subunit [Cryomorpha ignava]NEN22267.1 efflux RND transporter periplasmic adaptor subunit [Cryomorpha ignava]
MNWKKIIGIIIAVALVAFMIFKLKGNKTITEDKVYHYSSEEVVHVTTQKVATQNIGDSQSFTGNFAPNRESKLSAETQGKVKAVLVDAGDMVKKGQPLVELDKTILQLQLQSAEVTIEGLEADVNRYTILAEADAIQGIKREKAELGLRAAKIQRSTLIEQIQKSTVKAPFDGIITAKMTEEGGFAPPGVPLLQLTDIATLKFTANVSENDLSTFKINQKQKIIADAYPNISMEGITTLIGSKANMGNTFPVQFTVRNTPDLSIKAGMFGRLNYQSSQSEKAIIIPSSAIQENDGKTQVYVSDKGKAALRNVEMGQRIGDKVIITKGLNIGDILITRGFVNLFDGANTASAD